MAPWRASSVVVATPLGIKLVFRRESSGIKTKEEDKLVQMGRAEEDLQARMTTCDDRDEACQVWKRSWCEFRHFAFVLLEC